MKLNKYLLTTGICYALGTPISVHIGYMMATENWPLVVIETIALVILHIFAPIFWVKAQTYDLQESAKENESKKQ